MTTSSAEAARLALIISADLSTRVTRWSEQGTHSQLELRPRRAAIRSTYANGHLRYHDLSEQRRRISTLNPLPQSFRRPKELL